MNARFGPFRSVFDKKEEEEKEHEEPEEKVPPQSSKLWSFLRAEPKQSKDADDANKTDDNVDMDALPASVAMLFKTTQPSSSPSSSSPSSSGNVSMLFKSTQASSSPSSSSANVAMLFKSAEVSSSSSSPKPSDDKAAQIMAMLQVCLDRIVIVYCMNGKYFTINSN